MQMQTILKSPEAWTTSTIGGLTVKGAGGKKGVSGGTLKKMGNKWKGYKKPIKPEP
jgi:FAD/FMN-containing dehydrogenase